MGNKLECSAECEPFKDHYKKSPAYGHFELIINKDR